MTAIDFNDDRWSAKEVVENASIGFFAGAALGGLSALCLENYNLDRRISNFAYIDNLSGRIDGMKLLRCLDWRSVLLATCASGIAGALISMLSLKSPERMKSDLAA